MIMRLSRTAWQGVLVGPQGVREGDVYPCCVNPIAQGKAITRGPHIKQLRRGIRKAPPPPQSQAEARGIPAVVEALSRPAGESPYTSSPPAASHSHSIIRIAALFAFVTCSCSVRKIRCQKITRRWAGGAEEAASHGRQLVRRPGRIGLATAIISSV